jgi:hypothetical protein
MLYLNGCLLIMNACLLVYVAGRQVSSVMWLASLPDLTSNPTAQGLLSTYTQDLCACSLREPHQKGQHQIEQQGMSQTMQWCA